MSTSEMPPASAPGRSTDTAAHRRTSSAWVGWVVFAAVIAITMGAFEAIEGLVAIFKDQYYLVPSTGLVVSVDYTAWGWVHLIIGVVSILAGIALLQGRSWGRIVVIVLAGLSALVNLGFLSAYPIWATLVIAMDVIIIYALTVHWKDVTA
ncbi:MAG TPA: hypothetical protein VH573_22680 [Mycobacteriales bacterium]